MYVGISDQEVKLEFSLTINSHNLLNKLKLFEGKNALNLTFFGLKKNRILVNACTFVSHFSTRCISTHFKIRCLSCYCSDVLIIN